jgi:hypothetical protein
MFSGTLPLLFSIDSFYFALSALPKLVDPHLGALPQAITFRALGAKTMSFHTGSTARGSVTRYFSTVRHAVDDKSFIHE